MTTVTPVNSPTEIDHYQIRRIIDIYVTPAGEDLGRLAAGINGVLSGTKLPNGVKSTMRGMVANMQASFTSFAQGLVLALVLLYLILVAQFRSFTDPALILLAVPPGLAGVLLALLLTGTTLNVQSLMGVLMMVGIVSSNSILIVEFTHHLRARGMPLVDAVVTSCRIRLRPILMTSLATVFGPIRIAAVNKFWLDDLFVGIYRHVLLTFARAIGWLDRYIVDGVLNVVSAWTLTAGDDLRTIQTGKAQDYVYGVAVGVLILVLLLQLKP